MTGNIENNMQGVVCTVLTISFTCSLAEALLNHIQNGAAGDRLIGTNWAPMPTTIGLIGFGAIAALRCFSKVRHNGCMHRGPSTVGWGTCFQRGCALCSVILPWLASEFGPAGGQPGGGEGDVT
jgi:hypothetical protein